MTSVNLTKLQRSWLFASTCYKGIVVLSDSERLWTCILYFYLSFQGDINLHPHVGGSRTAIFADLQTIWSHAIEGLGIDKRDLENYRAVLVIPALYKRSLIKHYMTLLLQTMGFGHAFVLQDHVAATFGAGLGKSKDRESLVQSRVVQYL